MVFDFSPRYVKYYDRFICINELLNTDKLVWNVLSNRIYYMIHIVRFIKFDSFSEIQYNGIKIFPSTLKKDRGINERGE